MLLVSCCQGNDRSAGNAKDPTRNVTTRNTRGKSISWRIVNLIHASAVDNVRVHRAAANKLNIENRATRGSVCNALLCRDLGETLCSSQAPFYRLLISGNTLCLEIMGKHFIME